MGILSSTWGMRDCWIGWTKEDRQERLHHVMDAFVLGAVPPYSHLLCGKLVAMLAASNQVRDAFHGKYAGQVIYHPQTAVGQSIGVYYHHFCPRSVVYLQSAQIPRQGRFSRASASRRVQVSSTFANGLYEDSS